MALIVRLSGRSVGILQSADGKVRWLPDERWEADGQYPRLGVEFLRRPGPRPGVPGLPNWFENLLPEKGSELRTRIAAAHGLRRGQSLAILRAVGRDLPGAVSVFSAGTEDSLDHGPEIEVEEAEIEQLSFHFSALAGMQLKFSMSQENDRLVIPAQGQDGDWIVKFAGKDLAELPEIERATMSWAQKAGFDVPRHYTVPLDRLVIPDWVRDRAPKAFAVKRYDRATDGGRIHQEDLCQALDLHPQDKYGDNRNRLVSFESVLRLIGDVCGEVEAKEAARRLGFIIASGNDDAHLKNWSLLWGDKPRPSLTPCYDFVCTISWADRFGWAKEGGPILALSLGGEKRFRLLTENVLVRTKAKSGFQWAEEEILEGIRRARDAWRYVKEEAPPSMLEALDYHWREVPLLRQF